MSGTSVLAWQNEQGFIMTLILLWYIKFQENQCYTIKYLDFFYIQIIEVFSMHPLEGIQQAIDLKISLVRVAEETLNYVKKSCKTNLVLYVCMYVYVCLPIRSVLIGCWCCAVMSSRNE